jgi:hypothetical protein
MFCVWSEFDVPIQVDCLMESVGDDIVFEANTKCSLDVSQGDQDPRWDMGRSGERHWRRPVLCRTCSSLRSSSADAYDSAAGAETYP